MALTSHIHDEITYEEKFFEQNKKILGGPEKLNRIKPKKKNNKEQNIIRRLLNLESMPKYFIDFHACLGADGSLIFKLMTLNC